MRILRSARYNLHLREGGSIAANGGKRGPTTVTQLNPPKSELIEITGVGLDCGLNYLQLVIRQPATVVQLGTSQSPTGGFFTGEDSPRNAPHPLSLFVTYERPPATEWTNNHDQALQPTLRWVGYRYELEYLTPDEINKVKTTGDFEIIASGGFRS